MTPRQPDKRRVVKEPFAPGHIDMTPTGFRRWDGKRFVDEPGRAGHG